MGLGWFNSEEFAPGFHLSVTFTSKVDSADVPLWEQRLIDAAQRFHQACKQQLRINSFAWADDNYGRHAADIVVHPTLGSRGYAYLRRVGKRGGAAHVSAAQEDDLIVETIVHELGHYLFGVSDEYRTEWVKLTIDKSAPLADLIAIARGANHFGDEEIEDEEAESRLIPILPGQADVAPYFKGKIKFDSDLHERIFPHVTDEYVVTNAQFTKTEVVNGEQVVSVLVPQSDATGIGHGHPAVLGIEYSKCAADSVCLMDDPAGTRFCDEDHSPGLPGAEFNAQHAVNDGKSCWATIKEAMSEDHGYDLASAVDFSFEAPTISRLTNERHVAVVFDRSGSMNDLSGLGEGVKIADAGSAATEWRLSHRAEEYFSLVWYNDVAEIAVEPTELDQGSAAVPPPTPKAEGATNINAGLHDGLALVRGTADSAAAVKAVLLMTDGLHTHPDTLTDWADPLISEFRGARVPIYAIGFGTADSGVDVELLNKLADETGGRHFAPFGGAGPELTFGAAVQSISAELRQGIVVQWGGELGAADTDHSDPLLAARTDSPDHPKPSITSLLADTRLADLRIRTRGRRRNDNIVAIPILIEHGSKRAFFYFDKPGRDRSWFYLLDPSDDAVDLDAQGTRYYANDGVELLSLSDPKAGVWHALLVRDERSRGIGQYNLIVSSENQSLTVVGDCPKFNPEGAPVRLWALAEWSEPLSGITVKASITTPSGKRSNVVLTDAHGDQAHRGLYEGYYLPTENGHHAGYIDLRGSSSATRALAGSHPYPWSVDEKGRVESIASEAHPFVRRIPIDFFSGPHRRRDR